MSTEIPEVPEIQQRIKEKLLALGLPHKELEVYGAQIMVTCWSESAARKWHGVLYKMGPVRLRLGAAKDNAKVNRGTVLRPTLVKVWRVWASF